MQKSKNHFLKDLIKGLKEHIFFKKAETTSKNFLRETKFWVHI